MKHKLQKLLSASLAACFLLVGNMPLVLAQGSKGAGVEINGTNFPDEKFRTYLQENIDKDHDNTLSTEEADAVTYLYLNFLGISDLTGIENFANLKTLHVEMNKLTTLDVSQNKKLNAIYAGNNRLTSIKLPNDEKNDTLTHLVLYANRFTSLNLSNLNALDYLAVNDNMLTTLDLSENRMGIRFIANYNNLQSITLPNNSKAYEWVDYLAEQNFPREKGNGYEVVWYTNPEKTEVLDPNTTTSISLKGQTLYTDYQPIQYTVQFEAGGGTGTMEPQTFTYDKAEALQGNQFEKEHYTFAGWKMPNGKILKDGEEVKNLTSKKDAVIRLTATWTEKDYTGESYDIILHANGGTGEDVELSDAVYGTAYQLQANPFSMENHHFVGWALRAEGQAVYEDESSIVFTHPDQLNGASLELYAVWEKDTYAVSLVNGTESSEQSVAHGETVVFPEEPEKRGFTFEGWYTEEGEKWEEQAPVEQAATLYAKFAPVSYTFAFHGNGADDESAMQSSNLTLKFNQEGLLPENLFTKQYHTFMGWATSPDGPVTYIDKANVVEVTDVEGQTINLYAVWQQNTVTVTLNNGDQSEQKVINQGDTLELPTLEKTGYVFNGWKKDGGQLWDQEDPVEEDMTLTADFTPIEYTVVFDGNGADNTDAMNSAQLQATYDASKTLPENLFTKQYYTFTGWALEPQGEVVYQDQAEIINLTATQGEQIRLYAVWKQNVVEFTIHDGVKPAYTISVGQGDRLPQSITPNRVGYTLEGWYSDEAYQAENKVDLEQPVLAGGTLYAKWNVNQYTITFANLDREPIEFTVEDSFTLETPYLEGYDFVGWQDENGASVLPQISQTAKNMVLTAVWQKIEDKVPTVVQPDDKDVIVGMQEQDKQQAEQILSETLDRIDALMGNDPALIQSIQQALLKGQHVFANLEINALNQNKLRDADLALLQQALATLNQGEYRFELGSLMDISAIVRADSTVLGALSELSAPVRFSIAVPTQMQRTGRVFKVLTIHNGQLYELESQYENGIVTFETNQFSTFALVYGDIVETGVVGNDGQGNNGTGQVGDNGNTSASVQTGDAGQPMLYLALLGLSAGAAVTVIKSRKQHG